jgi:hypothetical protein
MKIPPVVENDEFLKDYSTDITEIMKTYRKNFGVDTQALTSIKE